MKYIGRALAYVSLLLASASCGNGDGEIFNGEIKAVKDKGAVEKEVTFGEIELKGPNYGFLSICDSLAIYLNYRAGTHSHQVFSLKSREGLGQFFRKGNGHGEFGPVGPVYNYYVEDNEMKALVSEANKEKVHVWNITKSLATGTTVTEREIMMPWREENNGACFGEMFVKDGKTIYARVQGNITDENETTLPYYQIRDLGSGEKTGEIHIFKKAVVNKQVAKYPVFCIEGWNAMKPDGSKIVQAMTYVPQLNIIDTESKKAVAYRLDYGVCLSDLENSKELKDYFVGLCADDDYIYTEFWGKEPLGRYDVPEIRQIYVFDWEGNFISKVTTNHCIGEMAVDHKNKILYTTSPMDEKLHFVRTDELTGRSK